MSRKKVAVTYYIRKDQADALERMRRDTLVPTSADVRRALDAYLVERGYLDAAQDDK